MKTTQLMWQTELLTLRYENQKYKKDVFLYSKHRYGGLKNREERKKAYKYSWIESQMNSPQKGPSCSILQEDHGNLGRQEEH